MANIKQDLAYRIPAEGSLGILALGAVGIRAWREKRREDQPMPVPHDKK